MLVLLSFPNPTTPTSPHSLSCTASRPNPQVCHVLVAAAAALGFWFYQPYYWGAINGMVVSCLGVGGLGSVLAFLVLLIPAPNIRALLGWLFIPVLCLFIPLGLWINTRRFVKGSTVSSTAFPTSVKFPFVDTPTPSPLDEETLEHPNPNALHSLISLPLYQVP